MNDKAAATISEKLSLNLVVAAGVAGAVYCNHFIIVRRRVVGRERVIIRSASLCSWHGVQQGLVPGGGTTKDLITSDRQPAGVGFRPLQMNDVANSPMRQKRRAGLRRCRQQTVVAEQTPATGLPRDCRCAGVSIALASG